MFFTSLHLSVHNRAITLTTIFLLSYYMNDLHTIDLVLAGNTDQFESLVIKYQDRVFRFLMKRINSPSVVEDLTQQTFLAAYQNLSSFNNKSKFSSWLIGIALNVSRNHINSNTEKNNRKTGCLEKINNHAVYNENHLESLIKKKELIFLKKKIDNLLNDLKEALILVSFEKFTYEEAARIMKVPVGTVKSKIYRARKTLKDARNLV